MNNENKILEMLSGLTSDMADMKSDIADMKTEIAEIKTDVADMKTEIADMKSDIADMKEDISELKTRVAKVEITQENVVLPKLELLAEGQTELKNQIRRMSVIEAMQDDIATLKTAVRFLSEKVAALDNAG